MPTLKAKKAKPKPKPMVKCCERETVLVSRTPLGSKLFEPGGTDLPPVDVSRFSAIRVFVFNRPDSVGPAVVFLQNTEMASEIGTFTGIALLEKMTVDPGEGMNQLIELPGKRLGITVGNPSATRIGVDIFVYGR
jgi:hypothetical protein